MTLFLKYFFFGLTCPFWLSLLLSFSAIKWSILSTGCCSIQFFRIVNPIQIHHKYVIDNPNPNPLFKMDWQSNPIPMQHFLEKFQRKKNIERFFEGKICNSQGRYPYQLNSQTFLWILWIKLAWLCFGQSIIKFKFPEKK